MLNTRGYLIYLIFIVIFLLSCSTAEKPKKKAVNERIDNNEDISEYDKEGFISPDLYRIVIVKPKGSGNSSIAYVKRSAKRRALVSLQKYIASNNGIISQNTKAKLLNLIDEYGELSKEDTVYESRYVYHFDIRKPDLKRAIDDLAVAR